MAGAVAPDKRALVLLQLVGPGDDPVAGARADGVAESQLAALRRVAISGLPAAQVVATTRDDDRVGLTWIAHRERVFRVAGVSAVSDWERYRPAFDRTASSFRPLRAADRPRVVQSRLRVRPAGAGETISQVLARGGSSWTPTQAAVANAVAVDAELDRGWPVKVAVNEPYAAGLSGLNDLGRNHHAIVPAQRSVTDVLTHAEPGAGSVVSWVAPRASSRRR